MPVTPVSKDIARLLANILTDPSTKLKRKVDRSLNVNTVVNYAKRNKFMSNVYAIKKKPLLEVIKPLAAATKFTSLFSHPGFRSVGVNKMLESAAFPNGLPKALEASVAVQLLSQGATSDSDLDGCSCLSGDECHCWTPRKAAPRVRRKGKSVSELPASTPSPSESQTAPKAQNPSNVSNRLADFRALLPKPAHDPSSSTALTVGRYHPHELYSPYGRAHGQLHPNQSTRHTSQSPQVDNTPSALPAAPLPDTLKHIDPPDYPPRTLLSTHDARLIQAVHPEFDTADIEAWNSFQMTGAANIAGSLCGCGDECACPGCIVHKTNDNRLRPNASKCGQPDACRDCLDCAASFSYQSSRNMPPNTALSIYDNTYGLPGRGSIDDWIRQMQNSISPPQPGLVADLYSQNRSNISTNLTSNSPFTTPLRAEGLNLRDSPSGVLYPNESADPSVLFGRSRSFDDLLSTYSTFDTSIPLDLSLLNGSNSNPDILSTSNWSLESLQDVATISDGLDLASLYRSRSASEASSEASGQNQNMSLDTFSDLGEMSSMSMFYHHNGTGAGGGRSSVKSLPDTLGYL